jgi:Bacterial regulatory helix-turn-helix protein, lysR family
MLSIRSLQLVIALNRFRNFGRAAASLGVSQPSLTRSLKGLEAHVLAFVAARNFAKHLKALRWRTPYQVICEAWTKDPSIFKLNPRHLIPGPHTYAGYHE